MSMDFIGKWSLAGQNGNYVSLDPSTGRLNVSGTTPEENQKFNAYGTIDRFMLQAANGKYAAASGDGYAANLERDGQVSYFSIEKIAASGNNPVRILDLGIKGAGATQYYLNDLNSKLQRIEKTGSPPPTTQFKKTTVTVGYAEFIKSGFQTPQPDLSWVYLAGKDLTPVMSLTQANLANAGLSGTDLSDVDMSGAILTGANLSGATITGLSSDLSGAHMENANLTDADLTGATIRVGYFKGATLIRTIFTAATMNSIDITDADLTGAELSNPKPGGPTLPGIDLSDAEISAKTNFTKTKMQYVDLRGHDLRHIVMSHADLTGSKLDKTRLENAELSYTNLTNVTLTGNVPMYGANLSNAILSGVNLMGAQMGSLSLLFRVPDTDSASFNNFKKALQSNDVAAVKKNFSDNGVPLQGNVVISPSPGAPGRAWEVDAQSIYTVRLDPINTGQALDVYAAVTAAILTNAFMKDIILTAANLYNVRASGAQLYGKVKIDGHAILERAQFDGANMGSIHLEQAILNGCNLDYTTLTGAQLQGAHLDLDAGGGQVSLARANLQGADFSGAVLNGIIFTDAAVSVAAAEGSTQVDGVWLFETISANIIITELENGVKQFYLDSEMEAYLTPGPAAKPLQNAFREKGVTLGAEALVTVQGFSPYWDIKDGSATYVIVQGFDKSKYVPALGVLPGTDPTQPPRFFIPLYLEKNLKNGPVNQGVIDAFKKEGGVTLSAAATVTGKQQPTDWQVVDSKASYTLWNGLDEDYEWSIFVRPSMPELLELFSSHSMPLSRRVTVSGGEAGRWYVDNDSNNPYNPVTNYITFNAVYNRDGEILDIYGNSLRVRRINSSGNEEYYNIVCALTKLSESQLKSSPSSVCPNSLRVETNISEKIPFKEWMRARILPQPPFCVPSPDGRYYCPPSGSPGDSGE